MGKKKPLWVVSVSKSELQAYCTGSLVEQLGIKFIEIGSDYLKATMPVDGRTVQPAGILHGGASATLAETLGSTAASLCVDPQEKVCVGQEMSVSHLRPVFSGVVTGVARPVHIGRLTHRWEVHIYNESNKMVCSAFVVIAIRPCESST